MSKRRGSASASYERGRHLPAVANVSRRRKVRHAAAVDNEQHAGSREMRGRTQWDAMAEVTNHGKWNATRMALLIFVRYAPQSALGAALMEVAMRLLETIGHHH